MREATKPAGLGHVSRLVRRTVLIGLLLAAIAALALPQMAAPASAAPRPYVVVMGDSYTTNFPDIVDDPTGCKKSPTSWPVQLHQNTRRPLLNVACSGSKLGTGRYNVYDQAHLARKRGGFSDQTRAVLIQLGFNSFGGGPGLFDRQGGDFPSLTGANYADQLRPLVTYVRHYAPNAKIVIVGYPELFAPHEREVCMRVAGVPVVKPGTTAAPTFMRKLQAAQQDAAGRLGVRFVNLQAVTRGHGLCGAQPWVNGVLYPNPGYYEHFLFAHPTPQGDAVAARTIARAL